VITNAGRSHASARCWQKWASDSGRQIHLTSFPAVSVAAAAVAVAVGDAREAASGAIVGGLKVTGEERACAAGVAVAAARGAIYPSAGIGNRASAQVPDLDRHVAHQRIDAAAAAAEDGDDATEA
jgi:hypothetical protein